MRANECTQTIGYTRSMLFRTLALVCIAGSAACLVDRTLPTDITVKCATQADCPAGFVCRDAIGHCVVSGTDEVPPALESSSVGPPIVPRGGDVTIELVASELLFEAPSITIA